MYYQYSKIKANGSSKFFKISLLDVIDCSHVCVLDCLLPHSYVLSEEEIFLKYLVKEMNQFAFFR